jgi:DNA polymerase I - 3''-5'' exonuclease and polymerase domains
MIYYIGEQRLFNSNNFCVAKISDLLEYFKDKTEIAIDTETTGFDPHTDRLLCIQFGTNEHQYVVNCSLVSMKLLKPIFEYNSIFLFQNAKFDLRFLMKYAIYPKKIYDTFLAELILTTGYDRKSLHVALDDLAWKYCNIKLDKTIRGNINKEGLSDRVIKYAADDTKWLSKIKEKQLEQIDKWNLNSILDLENEVIKVFAKMEYDGVLLDKDKWLEVANMSNHEMLELEKELDNIVLNDTNLKKFVPKATQGNLFGYKERVLDINWGSSQQKLDMLKSLGIQEDSTGDRILQRNKHIHNLVKVLIDYNKHRKLNDAFGKEFLKHVNPNTNRVHMDIWPILSTGRIAVSNPNLNQIPNPEKSKLGKLIRSCFIPKEGYKIVGGDYSGMELRIIAEFSQDPVWIDAFNHNKDLHSELAALTFNIDIKDVKKPFEANPSAGAYRSVQKIVNFGLAYGMSAFKLADTIQVSVDKAQEIIDRFFKAVPKVKQFLHGLGELGKQRGYIRTGPVFSRVRWFPEWHACQDSNNKNKFKLLGEIERASMNMPIQGCNGNIIKLALINTQKEINLNNWPVTILLSVYDKHNKYYNFIV